MIELFDGEGGEEVPAAPEEPFDLTRYKRMFDESRDATSEERQRNLRDLDYYDGNQWSAAEKLALQERKQPDIVINRVRAAVNGILGVVDRGRTDPRAYPRTPKDSDSAEVATDTLRFIGDQNRMDRLKLDCFRDMIVQGTTAAVVTINERLEVVIEQVRWEEFFYDPRSRRTDLADAAYMGVAKWMYVDDVIAIYPEHEAELRRVLDGSDAGNGLTPEFEDRPTTTQPWIDIKKSRLMVVEMYHREGGRWMRCVFFAGGKLEAGVSLYVDDKGQPCNAIVAMSAYVDKDNNRYGVVRDMIGPQDEINKRRSKLLHLLSTSQIQAVDPSAIQVNSDEARKEAAKPDGVIPYGWQKVQTADMAAGQSALLAEAKSEIERMGPNPAMLGRQGADSSGRALMTRQQAGMMELSILFSALEDWELRIWRACWARARQFWRDQQWVRVTDDVSVPRFVQLNAPRGAPVLDESGQPQMDESGKPVEGDPMFDMLTGQSVFGYKNVIAEMDVDIIIDATPDTANMQQEQVTELLRVVSSNPNYAQQVPFDLLLELSSIPHKRDLIDKIKKHGEQQSQMQVQMQAMAAEAAMREKEAEIEKIVSEAELNMARAQAEHADVMETQASYMMPEMPAAGDMGDTAY